MALKWDRVVEISELYQSCTFFTESEKFSPCFLLQGLKVVNETVLIPNCSMNT